LESRLGSYRRTRVDFPIRVRVSYIFYHILPACTRRIACGPRHSACLVPEGTCFMWGAATHVWLPYTGPKSEDDWKENVWTPIPVPKIERRANHVVLGRGFNAVLVSDGSLYVW
jgi:alpha-tubulin suppressor-like RCC1 family protein